jgi:hypothetical protein
MTALVFLAFFAVLSALVLSGHGADTRDPDYALGRVIAPRPASGEDGR